MGGFLLHKTLVAQASFSYSFSEIVVKMYPEQPGATPFEYTKGHKQVPSRDLAHISPLNTTVRNCASFVRFMFRNNEAAISKASE